MIWMSGSFEGALGWMIVWSTVGVYRARAARPMRIVTSLTPIEEDPSLEMSETGYLILLAILAFMIDMMLLEIGITDWLGFPIFILVPLLRLLDLHFEALQH